MWGYSISPGMRKLQAWWGVESLIVLSYIENFVAFLVGVWSLSFGFVRGTYNLTVGAFTFQLQCSMEQSVRYSVCPKIAISERNELINLYDSCTSHLAESFLWSDSASTSLEAVYGHDCVYEGRLIHKHSYSGAAPLAHLLLVCRLRR